MKLLALFLLCINVVGAVLVFAVEAPPISDPAPITEASMAAAISAALAVQNAANTTANYQLANLVINGVVAVLVAYFASRTRAIVEQLPVIGKKMDEMEKNTNSKMDKMLAQTATASKAEGVLEEKNRQEAGHVSAPPNS